MVSVIGPLAAVNKLVYHRVACLLYFLCRALGDNLPDTAWRFYRQSCRRFISWVTTIEVTFSLS